MLTNNSDLPIDKLNILEKIDQLSKNLEGIENSFNEISKNKSENINEIINISVPFTHSQIDIVENNPNNIDCSKNLTFVNVFEGVTASSIDEQMAIILFIKDNIKFNNLLNKLSLELQDEKIDFIKEAFEILSFTMKNSNEISPMKNIIHKIKNILNNNNLYLHDIPLLINSIAEILNFNLSDLKNKIKTKIKIDIFLINLLIKLIIHVLIELQIISTGQIQILIIDSSINSSLALLSTVINVPNLRKSSLFCCIR